MTNCFTLTADASRPCAQLVPGFQLNLGDRELPPHLFLQASLAVGVRIYLTDELVRVHQNARQDRLYDADVWLGKPQSQFIMRGGSNVTLLLFESKSHFVWLSQGTARPHFKNLITWVGVYGYDDQLQVGVDETDSKVQLCRLQRGGSCLFVDANKEATICTANSAGEPPFFRRARPEEVAEAVLFDATRRGLHRVSVKAWCRAALEQLGQLQFLDALSAG